MKRKSLKNLLQHRRTMKWISVNAKWSIRCIRRFFQTEYFKKAIRGRYAKCLYCALTVFVGATTLLVATEKIDASFGNLQYRVENKLAYSADYDTSIPYFRTLHHMGSSNHLLVTVQTAPRNNLSGIDPSLTSGNINLKITFSDQSVCEIPLSNHRQDNFFAGQTASFKVTLPFGYSPFDIRETALVLIPGASGKIDEWHCSTARISFLLGGKQTMIAKEAWNTTAVFGNGGNQLRSSTLLDSRTENDSYQQASRVFSALKSIAGQGLYDFHSVSLKQDGLDTLNLSPATALYIDVETVSSGRGTDLLQSTLSATPIAEGDELNFNGVLYAEITFNGKLEDGGFTKEYLLDTPGKDDFEMGSSSSFRLDLPKGTSIFDIVSITLRASDVRDAWAARFIRAYTPLDFDTELELARLTDAMLEASHGTCIFYKQLIDQPVSLDLSVPQAVDMTKEKKITETFGHTLTGTAREMYFNKISFLDRQILYYEHLQKIYSPEKYVGGE